MLPLPIFSVASLKLTLSGAGSTVTVQFAVARFLFFDVIVIVATPSPFAVSSPVAALTSTTPASLLAYSKAHIVFAGYTPCTAVDFIPTPMVYCVCVALMVSGAASTVTTVLSFLPFRLVAVMVAVPAAWATR